ncbi:hypothetical protein [Nocardia sp. NPDC050793]|uniref:hypothetical protein n=1 Tax=Nocardia sp. NPDC050793 TaxID=3155159 RepID=UPI0033E61E58
MRRTHDILGNFLFRADDTFRVEPLPRTNEVQTGLSARIHDPAWSLTRQWQLGEFAAQDAASPVLVELAGQSVPISAWRPSGPASELDVDGQWVPYTPASGPLDALIESEDAAAPDERLRVEGGVHFVRLLDEAGLTAKLPNVLAEYGFPQGQPETPDVVTLLARKVPDAGRLAQDLSGGGLRVAGLAEVGAAWLAWWREVLPVDAPDTFDPHRFEHRADFSIGEHVFHADEYLGDGLDWFTVDRDTDAQPAAAATPFVFRHEALASTVRFGGIPADRFWEMEDAQIDFGSAAVATLDTGRLLLIGFGTVYGNDWFMVPVEVPAGSFTTIGTFVVTDTFGGRHVIERAGSADEQWNLFTVTGTDDGLLVMPSERGAVGDPAEVVSLARDELANLAWAIERSVTGARGQEIDRGELWERNKPAPPPPNPMGSYMVQTIVPDYWLPLVPHALSPASIRFALVELVQPGAISKPLGRLLNSETWVHEEEVPREGALVIRRPVLARWFDGSWHTWVRREKNPGRGESSSGLAFDIVHPSEAWP